MEEIIIHGLAKSISGPKKNGGYEVRFIIEPQYITQELIELFNEEGKTVEIPIRVTGE